jgi:hypothetical protein
MAVRSAAWTVFTRLNSGFVGSDTTQGMDVCVYIYSVFVLVYVKGWSLVQGVLPSV